MYMPGRSRTASSPSRTVMVSALYSPPTGASVVISETATALLAGSLRLRSAQSMFITDIDSTRDLAGPRSSRHSLTLEALTGLLVGGLPSSVASNRRRLFAANNQHDRMPLLAFVRLWGVVRAQPLGSAAMPAKLTDAQLRGLRAARSAPALSVETVAVSAGLSTRMLTNRLRALGRGACAGTARALLASKQPIDARTGALTHPSCPPPLARASTIDRSPTAREAAAGAAGWAGRSGGDGAMTRAAAAVLALSDNWKHLRKAAQSPGCPPLVLDHLAQNKDFTARFDTARNAVSHRSTLHRLASDSDWRVRRRAAGNPSTQPVTLTGFLGRPRQEGTRGACQ